MSVRTETAPDILSVFRDVRGTTRDLARPLSVEDCQAQSMTEASPVKWHLAHTTWFFEAFVLGPFAREYVPFHEKFGFLYNSYYNSLGERVARPSRGLMTRPTLSQVEEYREHVDRAVAGLLESMDDDIAGEVGTRVELGLNHEQQHQELLLTDVKHLLSLNPLLGAYREGPSDGISPVRTLDLSWTRRPAGVVEIGHGDRNAFAFDNETPRHRRFLEAYRVGSRLVTCGEYLEFINDAGYRRPELWLSEGWDCVLSERWSMPLYWRRLDDGWRVFTLDGERRLNPHEPVCHVSYFEADAFARWAGSRLLREDEWESLAVERPMRGNFLESGRLHPSGAAAEGDIAPRQLFGDAWEWTQSQYTAYPGYAPPDGALGEYNGKFMCNQFVLRGGSCVTPRSHMRATYRNFFPPWARWQFSGIRLAQDDGVA